jgi:drug/metabolite transporter (DMT)-like permease
MPRSVSRERSLALDSGTVTTWKTYTAGIGYATIFGFSFLVTKNALAALDPFELLFLRFAVAALAMSALAALDVIELEFRGKKIRDLVLVCLLQPVIYFACETLGVRESATSTAGIILGALPAAVAILGMLMLNERLGKLQTFCLGLSVSGVMVIVLSAASGGTTSLGTPAGIAFLFGALASAAFYNIYSRKASRTFTPVETTFAMMWTGPLVFGAVALVRGSTGGNLVGEAGLPTRAVSAWGGIAYLGLLSSVLAFFCVNYSLSRLRASQSVVFANLTTVVAVVAGVVFRGEPFGPAQILGAAMIVFGVWGTNASGQRPLSRQAPEQVRTAPSKDPGTCGGC